MNGPPTFPPIGFQLARTARVVAQAFEHEMAAAGGSPAVWQVLLLVRTQQWSTQSEMAQAMGITGATLTHHLNALEGRGVVRRFREEGNRRSQQVELTAEGEALFGRLRSVAMRYDAQLRSQLSPAEVEHLSALLKKLEAGATGP